MAAPIKAFGILCQSFKRRMLRSLIVSKIKERDLFTTNLHTFKSTNALKALSREYDRNDQQTGFNQRSVRLLFCATVLAASSRLEDDQQKTKVKRLDDNDEVIQTIKRAKLAEMRQNYDEAEDLFHRAIAVLTMYGQNKTWPEERLLQARVYVYDSMANLALSRHDFQKAEGLFKETMRGLLQQGFKKTDNSVLEISLKLAMIYAMLQRLDDADKGYAYCIQLLEDKVNLGMDGDHIDDDTIALLGLCVDSYARFLMIQAKYPESLIYMRKALDLAIRVFGDSHPQVAVIYNDISTVLSQLGEYESAREHSAKAIAIAQKINSEDLPAFLCNMGAIHMYKLDFVAAEKTCKKALRISEKYNNEITKKQAEKCLAEIKEKSKQYKKIN